MFVLQCDDVGDNILKGEIDEGLKVAWIGYIVGVRILVRIYGECVNRIGD